MQFHINSMTCGGCAGKVTKVIHSIDADAKVTVDIPAHRVQIQTSASQDTVAAALTEAGYPPVAA